MSSPIRLVILVIAGTILNVSENVSAANILFYIGIGSHSHRTAIEPLGHRLVEEGHNVTFFSPMTPTVPNPKFEEFCPAELFDLYQAAMTRNADEFFPKRLADKFSNESPNPRLVAEFEELVWGLAFNSPQFKAWLANKHFDLVILDHTANKCAYPLAYKFGAPTILNMAFGPFLHEEDIIGLPHSDLAWLPNVASTNVLTVERTFYDKLYVTLYRLYSLFYSNLIAIPKTEELARKVLDLPDMPSIHELEQNTSLVFMNQHFSNDYARALPPHVIQVGGISCTEKVKPLPKNLQDSIDGAGEDGFIFMSFGTIVSMSRVQTDFVNDLFDTIRKNEDTVSMEMGHRTTKKFAAKRPHSQMVLCRLGVDFPKY